MSVEVLREPRAEFRSTGLFRSAAPYYARYRAGYPAELFTYLVSRLELRGRERVIDLGCGTGQVALPLAAHVARVVAVDPEPGMREEGRWLAAARGVTNVTFVDGDSTRLAHLGLGTFDVVTMGASFHWMDGEMTLAALDHVVRDGGAVVVIGGTGGSFPTSSEWAELIAQVRDKYLPPLSLPGPRGRTHAETFTHSPFSQMTVHTFHQVIERDVDSLVGLQLSYSFSTPDRFGNALGDFTADLRAALCQANPAGVFREEITLEAIVATRPDDPSTTHPLRRPLRTTRGTFSPARKDDHCE